MVNAPEFIPVSKPYVASHAAQNLAGVVQNNWLSPGGPVFRQFQAKLGEFVGGAVTLVNSGTSALEMAIRATAKVYGRNWSRSRYGPAWCQSRLGA